MKLFSEKVGFNLISPFYDWSKQLVFQQKIDSTQYHFLDHYPPRGNQLIIGGGTGKYLSKVLNYPNVSNVLYIDVSDKMIAKAKKNLTLNHPNKVNQVEFVCMPFQHFSTTQYFDGIHTPFFLDCLNHLDLNTSLALFQNLLTEKGLLYFSDFHPSKKKIDQFTVKLLYLGFNLFLDNHRTKLPDFEKHFVENRFECLDRQLFSNQQMVAGIYRVKK